MIKLALGPRFFRMTAIAFFTQPTEVWIVFFMTINTTRRCFSVFLPRCMAVAALNRAMFSLEDKIRGLMIKGFQIQLDDIRASSFMISVTMLALLPFHLEVPAMKPLLLFEVYAYRLMALQALHVLPTFFKQDMAFGTLRLIFGVPLNHGPRHQ
jgi:hypothetical protein